MTDRDDYFGYLLRRSALGALYRRLWLYPRLCRHLKGRALDIGCGLGDMLAFRPDTAGVDINRKAVAWCKDRGHEAHVMEPDVLPFPDQMFDSAILDNVLEHIADPQPLLAEIRRVLKPGGVLVAGVPGRKGFHSDPDHKVYYDERSLLDVLARAGFRKKTTFFMPLRLPLFGQHLRQYCLYGVFESQNL